MDFIVISTIATLVLLWTELMCYLRDSRSDNTARDSDTGHGVRGRLRAEFGGTWSRTITE
jgi:hypothetical protein